MADFEKVENVAMKDGIKFFKHEVIFEVKDKFSKSCISERLMRRFFSMLKNKVDIHGVIIERLGMSYMLRKLWISIIYLPPSPSF